MFCYIEKSGILRIALGCRHFSAAEAHAHWDAKEDRAMTRLALKFAEEWAKVFTDRRADGVRAQTRRSSEQGVSLESANI